TPRLAWPVTFATIPDHDQPNRHAGHFRPDNYGRALFTFWNESLVFVPTVFTTVTMTAAISATIMPYSTAVTPCSSFTSATNRFFALFIPFSLLGTLPPRVGTMPICQATMA